MQTILLLFGLFLIMIYLENIIWLAIELLKDKYEDWKLKR